MKDSQSSISLPEGESSVDSTFSVGNVLEGNLEKLDDSATNKQERQITPTPNPVTQNIINNAARFFKMPGKFWGYHTDGGKL